MEFDIETLEGTHHTSIGDWIIAGVKGEQYPCKPDIFAKTYIKCGQVRRIQTSYTAKRIYLCMGNWIP